jgi:hypothetical protein
MAIDKINSYLQDRYMASINPGVVRRHVDYRRTASALCR